MSGADTPGAVGASSDERVPCSAQAEQTAFTMLCSLPLSMRAHIRRCRRSHISPFCRGSPGNVPFWHVMPWSLHFIFRGARKRNEAKKRGRRPGEKSLSPERRSAQPVIPCQRISDLNVGATVLRNSTGCGTRPGVRSPDGASCAVTGIFLMAGVIKPLACGAVNTVRRLK